MLGPHLMMDCYGCDPKKLVDVKLVEKFLNELPKNIGMNKITEPSVNYYSGKPNSFDKGGISGFVIIAESHISIHTFPYPNGYLNVDIFSCKAFDIKMATDIVSEFFGAQKIEKKIAMRGREFSKRLARAIPVVDAQRSRL